MPRPRKHDPPLSESGRVSAWRKQRMQAQKFRSVSFLASPDEFSRIEAARTRWGLTTRELMAWLLEFQPVQTDADDEAGLEPSPDEASEPSDQAGHNPEAERSRLLALCAQGDLFCVPGCQDYLLATLYFDRTQLPGRFPFKFELLRGFASHREALQYYCLRADRMPVAHQVLLLERARPGEPGGEDAAGGWYLLRLRLNEIYPQFPEVPGPNGTLDYHAAFAAMRAEYANEF